VFLCFNNEAPEINILYFTLLYFTKNAIKISRDYPFKRQFHTCKPTTVARWPNFRPKSSNRPPKNIHCMIFCRLQKYQLAIGKNAQKKGYFPDFGTFFHFFAKTSSYFEITFYCYILSTSKVYIFEIYVKLSPCCENKIFDPYTV
jgi:hypothetical protein